MPLNGTDRLVMVGGTENNHPLSDVALFSTGDAVQAKTIALTNAQIKAIGTAIELIAAPGAGKMIDVEKVILFHDYGANALTGNHALSIGWHAATVKAVADIAHGDFALKTADHIYVAPAAAVTAGVAANVTNKNLAIKAADNYGGNAGNDTVWKVTVFYRIVDVPL